MLDLAVPPAIEAEQVITAVLAGTSGPVPDRPSMAAGLTAAVMAILAVLALLWAVVHVWVGRALGRHEARARLLALGLAMVNLVFLPFGTALGLYAGWVLLTDEGRQVFHPH